MADLFDEKTYEWIPSSGGLISQATIDLDVWLHLRAHAKKHPDEVLPEDVEAYVLGTAARFLHGARYDRGSHHVWLDLVALERRAAASGERSGLISQEIGDRVLCGMSFWPGHFAHRETNRGGASMAFVESHGGAHYARAAESTDMPDPLKEILGYLSCHMHQTIRLMHATMLDKGQVLRGEIIGHIDEHFYH